jgi:(p)ppGpp synthase/HD superfamily hydrolase
MSFDDYRDLTLRALVLVSVAVLGYLANVVLSSASRAEVKEMIMESSKHSQYSQDKPFLDRALEDLYALMAKQAIDDANMKDATEKKRQELWVEITKIKLEIEKLHLKTAYRKDPEEGRDVIEKEDKGLREPKTPATDFGNIFGTDPGE